MNPNTRNVIETIEEEFHTHAIQLAHECWQDGCDAAHQFYRAFWWLDDPGVIWRDVAWCFFGEAGLIKE